MDDKLITIIKEKPDDFPNFVLGPHNIAGTSKGFTVFETDDPDKLLKISLYFSPVLRWKFLPIYPVETIKKIVKEIK